jgi:signal transduction histidine kinase
VFSNGVLDRLFADAAPVAHSSLLIAADGTILAGDRNRNDATQLITADDPLMRRIAEQPLGGIFSAPLSPGTRDELLAYGQVPGRPVWVAVGVDRDAITARWRSSLLAYGLVAAIVSLALLLVSWLAIRRARAEQTAVLQLNTETKRRLEAEQRLRAAYRLEAVGQLAAGVAHDFNNLLYVVSGNLELISNVAAANDRVRTLAERAADAVARGSRLVASLLAFGQRQMLQTILVDINHCIAEFLPLIQLRVGDRVELALDLDPTLPLCKTNAAQLEAALLNVAINARDAMEGQGTLTIATRCADLDGEQLADNTEAAPGRFIAISLSDTGGGMSPEVAERAFEPFFTTKDIGQGTGLGLSQVFGFVRQLGGHVTIRSALGSGTIVTLFLPQT